MPETYNTVRSVASRKSNNSVIPFGGAGVHAYKMDTNDIANTRRARLRQVIDSRFGGLQARLCDYIGMTSGELSSLLNARNFGEKKARAIEDALSLPAGWLDGTSRGGIMTRDDEIILAAFAWTFTHATPAGKHLLKTTIDAVKSSMQQPDAATVTKIKTQ